MIHKEISSLQEYIWLDQKIDSNSSKYNIGGYVVIEGEINTEIFEKAIKKLVNTNDIFSFKFLEKDGTPFYFIDKNGSDYYYNFDENDHNLAISKIKKDFETPFLVDSEESLLFKIWLIKIHEKKYIWYIKIHHLMADGFSFHLIFNKVNKIYNGFLNNKYKIGSEIGKKYSYRDYIAEEREYRLSNQFKANKNFWLEKYKNSKSNLFQKKIISGKNFYKEFTLNASESKRLYNLANDNRVTSFQIFIGILYITISKYYRVKNSSIGIPVLNRSNKFQKSIIGPFINIIPINFVTDSDISLLDFLTKTKKEILQCYRHQRFQVADIIKNTSHIDKKRLYDIRLSYEKSSYDSTFGGNLSSIHPLSNENDDDPISIHIFDHGDGILRFRFDVNGKFISKNEVMEIISSYKFLIKELHNDINKKISEISICNEFQEKEIINISQGPEIKYDIHTTFILKWNDILNKYKNDIAVISNNSPYSYEILNRMSDKLAYYLNKINIKQGSRVVVDLPNSEKTIISILALFKLRAIYVPVDYLYPQNRKDYIINDCSAEIIITNNGNSRNYENYVNIDDVILNEKEISFKVNNIDYDDDAYIIYTSGSTGNPKGVVVNQNSLYDYTLTFTKFFNLTNDDIILQQSSLAFDTSIEEIFPILSVGGTIVFSKDSKDFNQILLECQQHNITILSTNPFVVNHLNQYFHEYQLVLKTIISGGDVIKSKNVNNLLDRYHVYNTYGPTEGTVCATYHRITKNEEIIPIGEPIFNKKIYILDDDNKLLPKGATGEIAISGRGIARGYLNKKNSFESSFINFRGERTYLTGDLGSWNFKNQVVFKGRKDDQLSYKGYRIEPEEIELQMKLVDSNIFESKVAIKKVLNNPILVAYITVVKNTKLDIEKLKLSLSSILPGHMRPVEYVVIDKLPLNSNGKIDKELLPNPSFEKEKDVNVNNFLKLSNWENKLIKTWYKLLNTDQIDINSNFFEVGGHSLLANQFISILRSKYNTEISLKDFYAKPTIKATAKLIESSINKTINIGKIPEGELIPLSFPQEQLWFLSQLYEDDSAYLVTRAIRLRGKIDKLVIEKVFNLLLEKHEILRTVFYVLDDVPYQKVLEPHDLSIPTKKISKHPKKQREKIIKNFILEEGNKKFDLAKGPLLRINLIKVSKEDNILVLCEHHLIHDGWTQGVLLREFIEIYSKIITDSKFIITIPEIQYKDYAFWQRNYLKGKNLENHLNFWNDKLGDMNPEIKLPYDFKVVNNKKKQGKLIVKVLSEEFSSKLRMFSKENKVTLFITMLTGFKILLSKFCNETDISVGTGVANRKLKELEGMLGMIINTIVLRTKFKQGDSLKEILDKVKKVSLESFAYEDTPFSKVVQKIKPNRKLGVSPLVQCFFGFMNTPTEDLRLPNLELEVINSYNNSSKFDLNIIVVTPLEQFVDNENFPERNEIIIEWEYNANLFKENTMKRMITMYEMILKRIISTPEQIYHSIDYIPKKESKKMLIDFNNTDKTYENDKTLVDLFQTQVELRPNEVALVFENNEFTYKELDISSNRLANYILDKNNIKKEDLIGIKLQRSEWLIISILAVLKSNASYIPINPNEPNARVSYIEKQTNCKLIIDEFLLKDFIQNKQNCNAKKPDQKISSKNLVYVMFTSGSTGQPKGVMIEHKSIVNRIAWMWEELNFNSEEIVLQKTKFTFDVSVWEIFLPLCWGTKMILCSDDDVYDPKRILSLIKLHNVTCTHFVPSVLYSFMKTLFNSDDIQNDLKSLQKVVVSGEVLPLSMVNDWYNKLDVELYNLYGPTEASIDVTYYKTSSNDQIIPLGKPIWNTQIYILNSNMCTQPIGVIGEIYIGGTGLARGYFDLPKLTSDKFLKSPFKLGERLYKTGDLGRRLPDGNIEFIGRVDEQIKLRGYRIELGEIEHHLSTFNSIEQSVVVLNNEDQENPILVAYIVSEDNIQAKDIKDYLSNFLPIYMIPSQYVKLETLPLTSSGKVDKKSLSTSEGIIVKTISEYVAPNDELEMELVHIWRDILKVNKVGVNDDFFEIGGHSLNAIKLINVINKNFNLNLFLKDAFVYKTIMEQKEIIELSRWSQNNNSSVKGDDSQDEEKTYFF